MRIFYFAPIDWDFIRQRPQHLAQRLSAAHDFFYIQPLGIRNLKLSDLTRAVQRFSSLGRELLRKGETGCSLHIRNLFFSPFTHKAFRRANVFLLKRQLRKAISPADVIWVTSPSPLIPHILSELPRKALIYELMDDYPKIHPSKESVVRETESWLLEKADLVIATSDALLKKARSLCPGGKIIRVGNGVEFAFFNQQLPAAKPGEFSNMGRIAGYVGTVDVWLDFGTILFAAEQRKDIHFVFIGPIKTGPLPERSNIHFLGRRDYSQIPWYCSFFDACLIPFSPSEFADSVNPVKLYEYFALGKPVVSYAMKELLPYQDLLYTAKDKEDFLLKLDTSLQETDKRLGENRKKVSASNDWDEKAREINAALAEL